jgi:hypothetical protein
MSRTYKEDRGQEVKECIMISIKEKNQKRNYEILKNANRKRFESVVTRHKKAMSLEEKMAKAQARRE